MSQGIHKRRLSALLIAGVIAATAVLLLPARASAHDELLSTDPAAGATVDALPAQITLTFDNTVLDDAGSTVLEVTDASGASLASDAPEVRDNTVVQPLAGAASGSVKVLWRIASADGHPVSGEYSFTVAGGAESPAATPVATPISATPDASATPVDAGTPSASASPVAGDSSPTAATLIWVVVGIVIVAVGGAIVYALTARARKTTAPAEGPDGADSDPGSER